MLDTAHAPVSVWRAVLESGIPSDDAIDRFFDRHTLPLQEDSTTTFVYRGQADAVRLHHWIHGTENSLPLAHLEGTELWHLSLQLPECSRIEYKLEIVTAGGHRLILDPHNPLLAHDPFGANSVCYGTGYSIPDWVLPDPAAAPGTIQRLTVESGAFGAPREVGVYVPAGWVRAREYPILIVHDGRDYVRYSGLKTVLDNLIHRRDIPPLVVALTTPGDRLREYAGDPRHAAFVADELLPHLRRRYSVETSSQPCGLMGASFGAVASLYTAWRHPHAFRRLLLQSGSFVATREGGRRRGREFRPVVAFTQLLRTSPRRVSETIYVSCGLFESLVRHNRELAELLRAAGMEVRYSEVRDGHNWENWRDRLGEALPYLFPAAAVTAPLSR